jgi:transcriptional regulator with XRE-family HTH domain
MSHSKRLRVFVRQDRIAREMVRRNMSQNGLARAMHVSPGYMSQLLRGARSPSPDLRERLQQFLHMDDFDRLFRIESNDGSAEGFRSDV